MNEEKLKAYKGKKVEFDIKPFAYASYHYHCKGFLYDYEFVKVGKETGTGMKVKIHCDFLFDLSEAETIYDSVYVKEEHNIDTSKLLTIPYNLVKFISNLKEIE